MLIRIEWLTWPLVQHMLGCLIPLLAKAQPRLAARFEIGWQPHYPDTLLFLTLAKTFQGVNMWEKLSERSKID